MPGIAWPSCRWSWRDLNHLENKRGLATSQAIAARLACGSPPAWLEEAAAAASATAAPLTTRA
ncbi:MAG: hypothetical protein ABSF38_21385, partial [Verrucomicrobiota bacterium]